MITIKLPTDLFDPGKQYCRIVGRIEHEYPTSGSMKKKMEQARKMLQKAGLPKGWK